MRHTKRGVSGPLNPKTAICGAEVLSEVLSLWEMLWISGVDGRVPRIESS